jgi:hypothetical protein
MVSRPAVEDQIRVPLLWRECRQRQLAGLTDIVPTILEMLAIPAGDGRDEPGPALRATLGSAAGAPDYPSTNLVGSSRCAAMAGRRSSRRRRCSSISTTTH